MARVHEHILKMERALMFASELISSRLTKEHTLYFEDRVSQYKEMWRQLTIDVGANFIEIDDDLWQIELKGRRTRILNHKIELDNPVILGVAGRKDLTHKLLSSNGVPVPDYQVFSLQELDKAYDFFGRFPAGCVVKPASGFAGKGVTTHVNSIKSLRRAAMRASLCDKKMIIEPNIPGESVRVLVVGGRAIHAVRRSGLRLTGDGSSTVQGLMEKEYYDSKRKVFDLCMNDEDCSFTLKSQGLGFDSVPQKGVSFFYKYNPCYERHYRNIRTVYNDACIDKMCQALIAVAEKCSVILGSNFLGVDIITTDISIPLEKGFGIVNEINTTPALHHHYNSRKERYPSILNEIMNVLLGLGAEENSR